MTNSQFIALYARVSTEEQTENFSIPAQMELLRSYCRSMNYTIYSEYIDAGYSGTTQDRPELQRLLRDAEQGKFQVILVYRIDRFFRSVKDLLFIVDYLDSIGVSFRSVTEPFDTMNPIGKFMLSLLGSIAQLERDTFIERSRMGKMRRAEEGYVVLTHPPFGYDYIIPERKTGDDGKKQKNGKRGYLVINDEEAETVGLIFKEYIKPDSSTYSVAELLTKLGKRTKRNGKWTGERVYAVLTDTCYVGEWLYKGIKVQIPSIIDRETFDKAQNLLKERRNMIHRKTPRQYLLRGLLRCGYCGSHMGGTTEVAKHRKNGKKYGEPYGETHYYRCHKNIMSSRNKRADRCDAPWIRGEELERHVLSYLALTLSNSERLQEAINSHNNSTGAKRAELENKIKDLNKKLMKLLNEKERILQAYREGVIEISDLKKEIDLVKEKQTSLEQNIEELRLYLNLENERINNINNLAEKYKNLNLENILNAPFNEKRDLLMKLVSNIWVKSRDNPIKVNIECIIPELDHPLDERAGTTTPLALHARDPSRKKLAWCLCQWVPVCRIRCRSQSGPRQAEGRPPHRPQASVSASGRLSTGGWPNIRRFFQPLPVHGKKASLLSPGAPGRSCSQTSRGCRRMRAG